MKTNTFKTALFGMGLWAAACGSQALAQGSSPTPIAIASGFSEPYVEISAQDQLKGMQRGVNVLGYNGVLDGTPHSPFGPYMFKKIKDAGFDTVRFNLQVLKHLGPDRNPDAEWLKRLDLEVVEATKQGLTVLIDIHDDGVCVKDVTACGMSLGRSWRLLAEHFENAPNKVTFELLNEPHEAIDAAMWNKFAGKLITIIRQFDETRNIIVGPTHWNSIGDLNLLDLPADDQHIIVTVHYYDPMTFTHQGAGWVGPEIKAIKDRHWGSAEEIKKIDTDFDKAEAWGKAHNRPIFLGEFGTYDTGPMEDRAKWLNAVTRSAEKHGFGWAYWQLEGDFIIYDMAKQDWKKPLLEAIIPAK